MEYQNLLARVGEVSQEAIREAAEELSRSLRGARRDPQDLVWDHSGWPRLLSERDREDYLRANLKDYDNRFTRESQVDTGVGDENLTPVAFDRLLESGHPVRIIQGEVVSKSPLFDPARIRHVLDQRKVNTPHRPETPVADEEDPFPGETIAQAVGRIRTVLERYPTAPRFGVSGPHPGLCKGDPEGCEACGFPKEKTDHCHRFEVCADCTGFGDGSCPTAKKMEAYGETLEDE